MYRTVFGSKVMIRGCTHDIINLVATECLLLNLSFFDICPTTCIKTLSIYFTKITYIIFLSLMASYRLIRI